MGNRFSDLGEHHSHGNMDGSDNSNDPNQNQNNSNSRSRTSSTRPTPTRSTDYSGQASPYSASVSSERVSRLLNSLREANLSQNALAQLQRAQNNRSGSRRRHSLSSNDNPLAEPVNIPMLPDMSEFLPSLGFLNSQYNSNSNINREQDLNIGDHPFFSEDSNGIHPALFSPPRPSSRRIPLPGLLNSVPLPFLNRSFSNQNNSGASRAPDSDSTNASAEGAAQNFNTRHQDLNRLLSATIRAISLTASENQQNIHNSASNEGAATPAAFMESFLANLTQHNSTVAGSIPRLSLISQATGNDDPSSSSIVRVFRLERNENSESESNDESNNQPASEPGSTTDPSALVPVLMIIIRSLTANNNNNNSQNNNPDQPNTTSEPNPETTSSIPRFPPSSLQEQILREHEASQAARANGENPSQPNPSNGSAEAEAETPLGDSHRRSWIIYVIGSTYPPDHPIFSSLYSDNPSYEDLLALTNILGPAVPQTTTQANVDKHLPLYLYDSSIPGISEHKMIHIDRCQVCLEDFLDKESIRLLECSHGFHKDCIDRWLTRGCNKCPICRSKAVPSPSVKPPPSDPSLGDSGNTAAAS